MVLIVRADESNVICCRMHYLAVKSISSMLFWQKKSISEVYRDFFNVVKYVFTYYNTQLSIAMLICTPLFMFLSLFNKKKRTKLNITMKPFLSLIKMNIWMFKGAICEILLIRGKPVRTSQVIYGRKWECVVPQLLVYRLGRLCSHVNVCKSPLSPSLWNHWPRETLSINN